MSYPQYHKGWNPRYVAYAHAHGHTPHDMLPVDEQQWPGGKMCGFILWNTNKWQEFLNTLSPGVIKNVEREMLVYHFSVEYDTWLKTHYPIPETK